MPNRYNQLLEPQQYVSQYVPLPLELIAGAGEAKQKESDANKALIKKEMLDDTVKSISEHDDYRNKYMKSFNDQAQALIGDPNIDFASPEGRAKVSALIATHSNDPNIQRMERAIVNKKETLKNLEDIKKIEGAYGYWNDPLLQEEKLKSMGVNPYMDKDGQTKEYEVKTINRAEDHNKPVYELFDKMKDDTDVVAWADFTGDKTAIKSGKKGWEGISAEKVKFIADQNIDSFKGTAGGQDFLRKLHYDYAEAFSNMDPKTAAEAENQAVQEHLYNIGNAYVHGKKIAEAGMSATSILGKKYDEEKIKDSLIGQTIEGQTFNAIEGDKEFNALQENGVIEKESDGTIKINWSELNKDTKASAGYSNIGDPRMMGTSGVAGTPGKASQSREEKQDQLLAQMKKMADIIGFKGEFKADNYEQILNSYNTLSKSRVFGEQLSAPVSNLESNKATRNWDLTTAYDPSDINKVAIKPVLTKDDKITVNQRQTNKNGEMVKKGFITHANGDVTPIAFKSNSLEDSKFFDLIGSLGISGASYQAGSIGDGLSKTTDGKNVIDSKYIPYIGNVTAVGNPRDKADVEYRLVTDKNETVKFSNYSDMQRYLESEYYKKVPEGKSDTQELLNQQNQYKSIEE